MGERVGGELRSDGHAKLPSVRSAEHLGKFIHETYVQPARLRGDKAITIRVDQVWEALNYAYTSDLIRGVLGSMKFRNTYRLPLVSTNDRDGHPTTFTFKLESLSSSRE